MKSNKIEWRGLRIALGSTEEPGGSSPVSDFSWEYLEKSFRDKYKVQWNQWNQYFLTGHRPLNPYVRFYKKIRFQTSLKNFNVILKVLSVVCDPVCFIFTTSIYKIRSYNIFFVQFLKCVINSTNIANKKKNIFFGHRLVNWPEPRFDVEFLWFHQISPPSFLVVLESSAYQTQGLGPRS